MIKKQPVAESNELDFKTIAVIKGLIMDATRHANSGHPGGAMSSTDFAYILFKEFLSFDPSDGDWFNRDRFILSAGHESMLLYSLLTLSGQLDIEELKQFRQFQSRTPGHPEKESELGIEATTGPLGQGVGMAGGIAVAEAMLQHMLGKEVIDHYTYILAGDGDLQEPVSLGAAQIMGHLGLGKVIMFYDKNDIQISGATSRSDSTDFSIVFQGLGWQVLEIDGHDHQAIREAIISAKAETNKPTIIIGKTIMAKGSATQEGDHNTHGSPFSPDEIEATKEKLGLPKNENFYFPVAVQEHFQSRFSDLLDTVDKWREVVEEKQKTDSSFSALWNIIKENELPELQMPDFKAGDKIATRVAFAKVLAETAKQIPNLVGGSADLEPSNGTKDFMKLVGDFTRKNRGGRNFAFGVREFPMATLINGMSLHGGIIPFGATFLVFADYARGALRLSALQELPVIYVFTHDSFYVGEDGPTHQPIEQLASLRAIPNFLVLRPADANETAVAMQIALEQDSSPVALILSRQNLTVLDRTAYASAQEARNGAYVLYQSGDKDATPDIIIIASGSEVHLAIDTAKSLAGYSVRVVNMVSFELFEEQSKAYREKVLPSSVSARVSLEAGSTFGWHKFLGNQGIAYGLDRFGESAPADTLAQAFGFTVEKLKKVILDKFGKNK